jgi:putative ABC transport system substrate-binding protein
MLVGYAENDSETQARLAAFRQGLEHLGWTEGRIIRIDYRFAPAGPDQAQRCAKELVARPPDILAQRVKALLPRLYFPRCCKT